MKITINSKTLLSAVSKIQGAVSSNPVFPITEDFLFTVNGGKMLVSATNLETSASVECDVMSDERFSMTLQAKTFVDALKVIPDQPITISKKEKAVKIITNSGKFSMMSNEPEDFPNFPDMEGSNEVSVASVNLVDAINSVFFATSNDSIHNPTMRGVYFSVESDNIELAATNSAIVSFSSFPISQSEQNFCFVIPKTALGIIRANLGKSGNVKVRYNENHVSFDFGDLQFIARTIDGKFPNFKRVIPTNNTINSTVNRVDFLNAMKRVLVFGGERKDSIVSLDFKHDSVSVVSYDSIYESKGQEEILNTYEGEEMEINFLSRVVLPVLTTIKKDEIIISMSSPNNAALIEDTYENGAFSKYVFMPFQYTNRN